MSWLRRLGALGAALAVAACAHAPEAAQPPNACRTPMPLELRARRISARLDQAYAHAPPLSAEESAHMRQLAACGGVGALGVGDGCSAQWDAARASGLADRYFLREGAFSIPERIAAAAAKPLGADRTRDLLTALATAHAAQAALEQRLAGQHSNDPLAMMLVGADLEQALICDASDLAAGRRRGAPYDPAATPPEGP